MTSDMDIDPPAISAPDAQIVHSDAITYWNSVSSDNNGMLGGYPHVSAIDLKSSLIFLTKLRRGRQRAVKQDLPPLDRVADCGAGIGRITKGLLVNVARRVDVVEPVRKFTDELVASVGRDKEVEKDNENPEDANKEERKAKGTIGEVINLGLQDWVPAPSSYDLIWNQWCLGHLTDAQLITYLERCKAGLVDGGWIVVKENMSSDPGKQDVFDEEDSSVTRHDDKFRRVFKEAGLRIVSTELQRGFPKELYQVRTYALQPE